MNKRKLILYDVTESYKPLRKNLERCSYEILY